MPVFHLCVPVICSLGLATCANDCACVAIVAVQTLVAPGADHPHNRIIDPISSCNPRRALTVLANGPSRNYGGRIRWRAVAKNGKTVADGAEGYDNKQDVMNELNNIKNEFGSAPIVEK
jgi:uncharacterized protein YegP (UPF0339 family)